MLTPLRLLIMGAPGAGTTTLAQSVATKLKCPHFDTDDYYWFTNDALPYRRKRNTEHRLRLLTADLEAATTTGYVVSGALLGWGEPLVPRFQAIVYCWLPTEVRLARIHTREATRYGQARIAADGDLYAVFTKFCQWAADYDAPKGRLRSQDAERAWLRTLDCPVLYLETQDTVNNWTQQTLQFLECL